jgi:alcohol dehydrogenase class IV
MHFEFATATRILFGAGSVSKAGSLAAAFGRSGLLVTGANSERSEPVRTSLKASGLSWTEFAVSGEPTVSVAMAGAEAARDSKASFVIACGGGAVIDAGKAIAALASNPGDPLDYLEVIGKGLPLARDPLPFIALPTTAGTGAEVTRNAVLGSPEHRVKVSLRDARMLPRAAIIDPQLALDLPPHLTAATGLDALTQLLEPLVSIRANPLTDALCRDGLPRAARALPQACANGSDLAARTEMALAALYSGLALANSGLGAVHGFAGPIGGMFPAPHGAICAALLAPVWRENVATLRRQSPDSPALSRYVEAARLLTRTPDASHDDGLRHLGDLVSGMKIPGLRTYGIARDDFATIASKTSAASSMKGNPVPLDTAALLRILEDAW